MAVAGSTVTSAPTAVVANLNDLPTGQVTREHLARLYAQHEDELTGPAPVDDGPAPAQRDRPLDQAGVRRHHLQELRVAVPPRGQLQFLVGRVLRAQHVARLQARRLQQPTQLHRGQRRLEQVDRLEIDAALPQEVDRLPAGASGRLDVQHQPVIALLRAHDGQYNRGPARA